MFNINILISLDISADEYLFLDLLQKSPSEVSKIRGLLKLDLDKLSKKGYIRVTNGGEEIIVREHYLKRVRTDDDQMWVELCTNYPFKVPSPKGGYRILHTADPDAASNKKLKKKYIAIVSGKPGLHQEIMEALKEELRAQRSSLQYLQNLETWLNNSGWEKYLPIVRTGNRSGQVQNTPVARGNYGETIK